MSASAVRGGQVYVEIGANPSKLMSALTTINTKIADVGHRRSEISDLRVDDPQRVQQLRRVRTDLDVDLASADC